MKAFTARATPRPNSASAIVDCTNIIDLARWVSGITSVGALAPEGELQALAVALDPQGPGTQVSWDNPASTRKGTFTPTGAPFVKDDEICRDFSAHLSSPSASALQGTACRPSGGEWAIKDIKPTKGAGKA